MVVQKSRSVHSNRNFRGRALFGRLGYSSYFILILSLPLGAWAQNWTNPCFSNGLAGWTVSTNAPNAANGCGNPTATSVNGGTAPNTAGQLSRIPPNGCCPSAVQLYSSRGDDNHRDWARIQQTSTVPTNGNTCLSFWFAGVFESHHYDTGDTTNQSDSYLQINVIVGGATVATMTYSWENNLPQLVQLSNNIVPANGDGTYCDINGTPNRWGYLPWTQYVINLCPYAGQQVTFQATDYDCDAGGHYGFGYISCLNWDLCSPPNMVLTKTNNPAGQVNQGQTITYNITYTNQGNVPADGVVIDDTLPANTTFVPNSMTSNPIAFFNGQTGNDLYWDVGYVAAGASGTVGFKVVAPNQSCVTFVNVAHESDLLEACGDPQPLSNPVTNWIGGCSPTPSPTRTATSTFTSTSTKTSTSTATSTFTSTSTNTATDTSTSTNTATSTATATSSFTGTSTFTSTSTSTSTDTATPTNSPTSTFTNTATSTSTFTSTSTDTATSTNSSTLTFTKTATSTSTFTSTSTDTATSTHTATSTATATSSFTGTATFTSTSTNSSTDTATATATSTLTATPSPTNTDTDTYTPVDTNTPSYTFTATSTATATSTSTSTDTFTATFTATATATATSTFTDTVTNSPTNSPTSTYTSTSTNTPTNSFTFTMTPTLTFTPTPTPDGEILKTSSESLAHTGDMITYSLALTVTGNMISNVQVTDALPAFVTYQSAGTVPAGGTVSYDPASAALTWNWASLATGVYEVTYQVKVADFVLPGVVLTNQARLTYAGQLAPKSSTVTVPMAPGYQVIVAVYNEAGELVSQISKQLLSSSVDQFQLEGANVTSLEGQVEVEVDGQTLTSWNADSQSGTPVSNGVYYIQVQSVGPDGSVTSVNKEVTVSRSIAKIQVAIYNEVGEIVRHIYSYLDDPGNVSLTQVDLSSGFLRTSQGPPAPGSANSVTISSPNGLNLVWDGRSDAGVLVTNGEYLLSVDWVSGDGNTTVVNRGILVQSDGSRPTNGNARAMPNILKGGVTTTMIVVDSNEPFTLKLSLYDVSGQFIRTAQGAAGTNQAALDLNGLASGLYLVAVELRDANGHYVGRQMTKVVLEH